MASVQYGMKDKIVMQLNIQEKASLDQTIEHAKRRLVSTNQQPVWKEKFCVFGALKNRTTGDLTFKDKKIYSGTSQEDFPVTITNKENGSFCVTESTDQGVKVALVYSGQNKAGVECGWLLAFADTEDTGKRIYAECGAKDKFNYVNWDTIEMYLDKAGTVVKASDEATGTSLCAKIEGFGGKSIVGADFKG